MNDKYLKAFLDHLMEENIDSSAKFERYHLIIYRFNTIEHLKKLMIQNVLS